MIEVNGLYAGSLQALPPKGKLSGIFKQPVENATIGIEGLLGDQQADRQAHGGPEQAVHQYAVENYAELIAAFPALQNIAVAGSIGENLSAAGMTERSVYIGDIYKLGEVELQVSQPRSPCWKINSRFNEPKLVRFVADNRLVGWYYRVLKTGEVNVGDAVSLLQRSENAVSIDEFLAITAMRRPPVADIQRLLRCEGLSPEWQQRLTKRQSLLQRIVANVPG